MKTTEIIRLLERPQWAQAEFEQAPLVDWRLNQRVGLIASDFARHPGAPPPQACETEAKLAGFYRFVENDFIDPQQILLGHRQATLTRLAGQKVVLIPQDTTSLNFSHLKHTTGLGSIGTKAQPGARGLWLHSTLSFTPEGLPLGLLAAQFWSRPPKSEEGRNREQKAFAEKESVRWLQSWQATQSAFEQVAQPGLWVNIADMEGDIYEVFAAALAHEAPRVELLIRCRHDRRLVESDTWLWDHLASQGQAGRMSVPVPRQEGQPGRQAQLAVRFTEVCLAAPGRKSDQPPLRLWAIEAREVDAPPGVEPILWRLLTTMPIRTVAQAIRCVQWYARRWKIEVFHKLMKSVCRAEAYQLETAERLQRALMVDLVVAWRVQVLTQVGRQEPDRPATDYFAEPECQALSSYIHRRKEVPEAPPGLGEMMQWIGRLGGFLRSKANPHPGPITLARGLKRLNDLTTMYVLQNTSERCVE
jgi:hypothetical protein